jgi:hypothetical protein
VKTAAHFWFARGELEDVSVVGTQSAIDAGNSFEIRRFLAGEACIARRLIDREHFYGCSVIDGSSRGEGAPARDVFAGLGSIEIRIIIPARDGAHGSASDGRFGSAAGSRVTIIR